MSGNLINGELVKIDKHISDLLHENDCVIVPDMGGFLNAHPPADIQFLKDTSGPISTKLQFNVLLNYNDGILADHIVQHAKLSYDEALKEIEKFVNEFHFVLDSGEKFEIEQVGILYKDAGQNIQIRPFENLNYLNDPAEISDLQSPSVLQNGFKRGAEKQPEILVASPTPKRQQRKHMISKRNKVIIFALLLTVSILAFYLYYSFSPPSEMNSVSLNSHALSAEEEPADKNASKSESEVPVPASDATPEIVDDGSLKPVTGKGAMQSNPSSTSAVAEADMSENKFYIIAGSFRLFDNANRKLDELKLHGFKNAQIFSNSRHFHLVCYGHFNTLEEANENINSIRMQYKEAWIYSR